MYRVTIKGTFTTGIDAQDKESAERNAAETLKGILCESSLLERGQIFTFEVEKVKSEDMKEASKNDVIDN